MEFDKCVYAQMQKEQDEYEYYTVEFKKIGSLYTTNPDHPLLKEVIKNLNIVKGQAIFTQFELNLLRDKLELHQANIIIK